MKNLVLSAGLLLAASTTASAQASATSLPIDSTTQKITYRGVVQVPDVSKAELYSRAREWFATAFGSAKAVLEMDDREAGKLVGKAYAPIMLSSIMNQKVEARIWRVLKVELKDGRFRYTITDFEMSSMLSPTAANMPIERWLASATRNGAKPTKMSDSMVEGVKETAESEVNSLSAAMKKPATKDKDW